VQRPQRQHRLESAQRRLLCRRSVFGASFVIHRCLSASVRAIRCRAHTVFAFSCTDPAILHQIAAVPAGEQRLLAAACKLLTPTSTNTCVVAIVFGCVFENKVFIPALVVPLFVLVPYALYQRRRGTVPLTDVSCHLYPTSGLAPHSLKLLFFLLLSFDAICATTALRWHHFSSPDLAICGTCADERVFWHELLC
jgi:hypothetical protein